MAENLIEPKRIKAIQESIWRFLQDEVINPNGGLYTDPKISVWVEWIRIRTWAMTRPRTNILYKFIEKHLCAWQLVNILWILSALLSYIRSSYNISSVYYYNKCILLYARYEYIRIHRRIWIRIHKHPWIRISWNLEKGNSEMK